jgi:Site-specific recombinase XerD
MEVSFYLRKELINKKGYAPIRMHISFSGQLLKKSIKGISAKPDQWQEKRMRIRPNRKTEEYNFYIEHNEILQSLEERVADLKRYILLNKIEPTKEFILEKLEQRQKINVEHDFFETFEEFIEANRPVSSKNTIKAQVTVKNFLKDFVESTGSRLLFEEINIQTFDELRKYAFDIRAVRNNYFAKIIAVLKRFMSWAEERDFHTNQQYRKFKAPEEEIEVIFLSPDELMLLYNYDFKSERLQKVSDFYCFGCFTGLRFSDIANLQPSNIHEKHIKINIKKTREIDHIVPLNKFSKAILDKYKGTIYEPIPAISSQKLNDYIKECCKEVGIDTPVTISRYIGSKRQDITLPKYQLITSHTARKTFATVSLILGMSERHVKSVTGHKRDSSFNRYVKIANEEIKKQMENTWDKL